MLIPWSNLLFLFISLLLFAGLYIPSLRPALRAEKHGDKAWTQCKHLRTLGTTFMVFALITIFLWIWFPIPELTWPIHFIPWIGIFLAIVVFVIPIPIWVRAFRDSGTECGTPSPDTQMFVGIYQHIRHPQTVGEISWFIAVSLFVNSLFHLIVIVLFLLIYIPTMLYVEERDLIRRFGDAYRNYQKKTGALIPKLCKSK
ncbi:MAG: methyltransferase family protein [Candidatus Hermodarchaeia archaeon]